MSTSDQDQDQRRDADVPIADTAAEADAEETEANAVAAAAAEGDGLDVSDGQDEKRLTPRQARRLRILLSSLGMAAMALVLALRIASRSSVLVVRVYGLALILCGVMIELSRNGRTRLASWLLGAGLLAAVGADWLLLP
ncbi:Cytochrome d ubiquinol oxidase subunit II OS=Streptomyces cyaneofuscatus OX=66883 GN=G3I52_11105 PE=4 SV=1 [Streptomyces cyaneofuscatus]